MWIAFNTECTHDIIECFYDKIHSFKKEEVTFVLYKPKLMGDISDITPRIIETLRDENIDRTHFHDRFFASPWYKFVNGDIVANTMIVCKNGLVEVFITQYYEGKMRKVGVSVMSHRDNYVHNAAFIKEILWMYDSRNDTSEVLEYDNEDN